MPQPDPTPVRAAVLSSAPGALALETLLLDDILEPDEIRLRVSACGLCHSDLHMLDGDLPTALPTVPGHEISGIVEAVGANVHDLDEGSPVVACLSMFCGECAYCRAGRSWLCDRRSDLGRAGRPRPRSTRVSGEPVGQVAGLGGLAEAIIVHRNAVVEVPATMPLDLAALLGCAVLTGVGSAIRGAGVRFGETVAVIGVGGVGLNVIQGAKLAGARTIIAVDTHPAKLELAACFGATDLVDAATDPVAAVLELTGGVDHAFDVVGRSSTATQAVQMLRPGQTAWIIGIPPVGAHLEVPGTHLVTSAKGIRGLLMGNNRFTEDIPLLAELYLRGRLELDALLSQRLTLDHVNDGFSRMRTGATARTVICLDNTRTLPPTD
ncbi:zinc-binding dehydrogenase [Nocardia sp. NPDC056000]|uniref:zinc-binding dehydrogenase n=1 Tax=Nocardia sp. NPDC056000 TaxID=3345674 RepID=UPI0035DAA1A2